MSALLDILGIAEIAEPAKWPVLGEKSARAELAIQAKFRAGVRERLRGVRVAAIPNGTHIASFAGRRKADLEGRSTGFPDVICLWVDQIGPRAAFIEFKRGDATACDVDVDQREWLDWLRNAGFPCCASRDEGQAIDWLIGLGAPQQGPRQ